MVPGSDLPLDDILAGYTRNAAFAGFMEDRVGTIEAGKLADLVVLDRDLRKVSPQDVLHAHVEHTMVGGKVVYEGGSTPDRTAELPSRSGGECACHRLAQPFSAKLRSYGSFMKRSLPFIAVVIALLVGWQVARACTGIRLIAKDGTVVVARTLEFGFDLQSKVGVFQWVLPSPRRFRTTRRAFPFRRSTASSAPTLSGCRWSSTV